MSLDTDTIVDRRRLKRRLFVWRLVAVAALVVAVIAVAGRVDDLVGEDHVARFEIKGLIVDDPARDRALEKLAKKDNVKAVLLRIDSPGGTVVGGEALHSALRRLAEKKPLVAVIGETGTSAAYMAAVAADHIVVRAGSITGSIGVLMQTADITPLLDKIGVKPESIKSGALKAQPNPLEPMTPEVREVTKAVVLDFYEMFVDMVAERRGLDRDQAVALADGRIFTGRQALANGLADVVGGEPEAREWLEKQHEIDKSLPLKNVKIERPDQPWRQLIEGALGKALFSERLRLDGLVSVWHPEG